MDILTWVERDFGLRLRELVPIETGADTAARLFRGVGDDGARYAVKWTAGGSVAGLAVPTTLGAVVPGSVAAPLTTSAGALWTRRAGRRLSVLPWLEGGSGIETGLTREQWRAYGRLLRHTHELPVTAHLAESVPSDDGDPGRWLTVFDTVDSSVDSPPADDLVGELRAHWKGARERLHAVRRRALSLFAALRDRPAERVVCHGDPHLGNLIVTGADSVALIDWDDAVLASRERDLLFLLGGGVLPDAPVTDARRTAFLTGYGDHDVDEDRLASHRCVRALEDVAEPAARVLDTTGERADRTVALGQVSGVLSPTGLVDQALSQATGIVDTDRALPELAPQPSRTPAPPQGDSRS